MRRTVQSFLVGFFALNLAACGSAFESAFTEADFSAVEVSLPSFDQMASSQKMSAPSAVGTFSVESKNSRSAEVWGLNSPTSLAGVVCYAVAVEWPNSSDRAAKCKRQDGSVMIPGLFQGLYLPGQKVQLKIPSGAGRRIYLLGFAASSAARCVEFRNAERMDRAELSAPLVLGELNVQLEKGRQSLAITASMTGATALGECTGEAIDGVPAPPATEEELRPPVSPTPVEIVPTPTPAPPTELPPESNAFSCTSPAQAGLSTGSLACYGLWDFGSAFGNDRDMCGAEGASAYNQPALGCKVKTTACASGTAVASKVLQLYKPWDSASDIAPLASAAELVEIADRLNSSEELVRSNVLRVWQYSCDGNAGAPVDTPTAPTGTPIPNPIEQGSGAFVGSAITCGAFFSSGASITAGWQVLSRNQCLSYCDAIANNNPTSSFACKGAGVVLKDYVGPRTQLISPEEALACVARVTQAVGTFDYKAPKASTDEQCRSFCSGVNVSGATRKQCLSYDTVLTDSAAASSVAQIGLCSKVYNPTVPAGTSVNNSCSGVIRPPVLTPVATGSPSLVTIEQYETAGYLHGWTTVNGVAKTFRSVGEVTIQIAPGVGPIYLAFKSYEPTNIVITGDVSRVVKMYVVGYECQSVVGLDPAKVFINSYSQNGFAGLAALRIATSSYSQPLSFANNVKSHVPEVSQLPVAAAFGAYSSTCQPTPKTYFVP